MPTINTIAITSKKIPNLLAQSLSKMSDPLLNAVQATSPRQKCKPVGEIVNCRASSSILQVKAFKTGGIGGYHGFAMPQCFNAACATCLRPLNQSNQHRACSHLRCGSKPNGIRGLSALACPPQPMHCPSDEAEGFWLIHSILMHI